MTQRKNRKVEGKPEDTQEKDTLQGKGKVTELRRRAEEVAREKEVQPSEEAQYSLHELRVHQLELELQNEELVRTQLQLEASRSRYFDLYDLAPTGYFTLNEDGLIQEANFKATTLLGVPKGFLINKRFSDFVHHQDISIYNRNRKQLLAMGDSQTFELRIAKTDASFFWVQLETSAGLDVDNLPVYRYIIIDIDENKKAEANLRQSEKLLATSEKTAHLGSWVLDLIADRLTWSEEVYRIFGIEPQASPASYEDFLERVYPEDREAVDFAYRNSVKKGKDSYEIEHRVIQKSTGLVRYVYEKCEHFKDLSGSIVRSFGIIQDITDRKKIEEELREANQYLENLFNFATAPIIVWDRALYITRFNPSFELLSGYNSGEIIGKKIDLLFPKSKIDSSLDLINKTLSGERWESVEIEVLRKDKDLRTVLWNSANVYDKNGKEIVATIAHGQDITKRKKAEVELIEAKRKAEDATKAKSQFVSSMSHEIRTPLNGVIGFTDLLLESDLKDNQKEFAEYIRSSAQSLLALVDDILDFSKIEAGKMELYEEPCSVAEICKSTLDTVRLLAIQKGLDLKMELHPNLPQQVMVDPNRLRQVLLNLLSNAIKFTERGEVVLTVSPTHPPTHPPFVRNHKRGVLVFCAGHGDRHCLRTSETVVCGILPSR